MLCVDEKSQIQALDRTAPMLPMQPGLPERRTHDYVRHGTTTLFAALDIATGKVTARCQPRHRHQEFLRVPQAGRPRLPRPGAAPGDGQLRRPQARRGPRLAGRQPADPGALHPDLRVVAEPGRGLVRDHRTPGHPPRHASAASRDLTAKIRAFIDGWNHRCQPFVWTKTADQILTKADRKKTSDAAH